MHLKNSVDQLWIDIKKTINFDYGIVAAYECNLKAI